MTAQTHEPFIREAVELAQQARTRGDHPFGALLVYNGQVVMRGQNTVVTLRDITGHAELNLVRDASMALDADFLQQCTLYTSTEPCAMCATSIYWAGIKTVVYGVSAGRLYSLFDGGEKLHLPCEEVFSRGTREGMTVIGPILEDEAVAVHTGFWDGTPS